MNGSMSGIDNAQNVHSQDRGESVAPSVFTALARELAAFDGLVVGVMEDPAFAGQEVPAGLRCAHFQTAWAGPDVRVVPLTADQIRSHAVVFRGAIDVLVFPYGGVYPMEAFKFYSGQSFQYLLRRGGAVLTTGGIPFSRQADPWGKHMDIGTPQQLREVFDKWIAKFGVKYYQCEHRPAKESADPELLPELAGASWTPSATGVVVVNSAHEPVPKPPAGNVFPERTPARTVLPLIASRSPDGQMECVSAVLSQDFIDGSRRIHFTHEGDGHPLDPAAPHFKALLIRLLSLLRNRLMVQDVEAGFACYRQGEEVAIRGEVASHEPIPTRATVLLEVLADDRVVFRREEARVLPCGLTSLQWTWRPERFDSDAYQIRLSLRRDGALVSRGVNGFVVWDEEVIQRGPRVGRQGAFLTINGKPTYITGTNYYESTRGEAMWYRPDVWALITDHRRMQADGVNMIRPHYHHRKWFRDYLMYHHGRLPDFYRGLEDCRDPVPDERTWRIWDAFIYLGHKHGIVYNGDLFTLVPEEMGDPRGWFGTVEAVYDQECRATQKEFLLALDRRYRQAPGIAWDLFNEPYGVTEAAVHEWARDLQAALRADGSDRVLCVGGGPIGAASPMDFDCPHGRLNNAFVPNRGRALLLQELHVDRPEGLADELEQRDVFREIVVTALKKGACGWMPWSWTRQMRLWQDSYEHHHSFPMEKWDDRLGMHRHEDGTYRPAGILFRDLAFLMQGLEPMELEEEGVIRTAAGRLRCRLAGKDGGGHQLLYVSDGGAVRAMARGRIERDGHLLLRGPDNAYLFLRQDGPAAPLWFRCEAPGPIELTLVAGNEAEMADPFTRRRLGTIPGHRESDRFCMAIPEHLHQTWFRVE
jgi:hypothetical protein